MVKKPGKVKLIHHEEWCNTTRQEFEDIYGALQRLISCFECDECREKIKVLTDDASNREEVRVICGCEKINWNLKSKSK